MPRKKAEPKTPAVETPVAETVAETPVVEPELETETPDLETETPDLETETPNLETEAPELETETPVAKMVTIIKGRTITTLQGIKGHGDEITAKILSGGEETLRSLYKRGLLVEG